MDKGDFVELVKSKGGYPTKAEAEAAIKAFTSAITEALAEREEVSIVGFGSFEAVMQRGKSGKVPGTNRSYVSEDKMVPKFRAGKTLKDAVAAGK